MTVKEKRLLILLRTMNRALKGLAVELSLLSHEFKTPDGFREFDAALADFEKTLNPRKRKKQP